MSARYYDLSVPIHDGMLSWPSNPDVKVSSHGTIAERGSNSLKLVVGSHFGTHVDAPRHFFDDGRTIDQVDIARFLGPVLVVDLTSLRHDLIGPPDLEPVVPAGTKRLILKTRNTVRELMTKEFTEDYVALSGDGAQWLANHGLQVVGIDYLSIQKRGPDRRGHTELLGQDIVILEGLWLADVPAGDYELICLPLRIKDGDGAPARVVLRQ